MSSKILLFPATLVILSLTLPSATFSSSPPGTATCPDDQFQLGNGTCCKRCSPGFGVTSPCVSNANNTACSLCSHGATFSNQHSHYASCKSCSQCGVNAHVARSCNVTHDTQCACDPSFYMDKSAGACRPCDVCKHGWGASQPCTSDVNTICRKCPNSTYSDAFSSTMVCIVCTKCASNEILLQPCNAIQDTICLAKDFGKPQPTPAPGPPSHYPPTGHGIGGRGPNGVDIIPIYCFLLGLIVVGLIGYVAIKHWRMCQQRKAAASGGHIPSQNGQYGGVLTSLLDPSVVGVRGGYPYYPQDAPHVQLHPGHPFVNALNQQKTPGSDSGIFIDVDCKAFQGPIDRGARVRDLPSIKRREIEAFLMVNMSPTYTWKVLAREMGFSTSRIAAFEMRSEREKPHLPAVRYMLSDWMKNEGATVGALQSLVQKLGRYDVVNILNTYAILTPQLHLSHMHSQMNNSHFVHSLLSHPPQSVSQQKRLDDSLPKTIHAKPSTAKEASSSKPVGAAAPPSIQPLIAATAPASLAGSNHSNRGSNRNSYNAAGVGCLGVDFHPSAPGAAAGLLPAAPGGVSSAASAPHLSASHPKSNLAHLGNFPQGEMV